MEFFKDELKWDYKTRQRFQVIVIGAGIAGLAAGLSLKRAGHDVVIFEQAAQLVEVGAGIQIPPNASRILGRLELLEKIISRANILESNSLRRWQDNKEIGVAPIMPQAGRKYNAPSAVIHRGDLQRVLLEAVYAERIEVRLNHKVIAADKDFKAKVQIACGRWIEGDVIIAADGIKSGIRRQMAEERGITDSTIPTGDAAYRVIITEEKMHGDKRGLKLLKKNVGMRWMGPGGHIMGYPIKSGTAYNMVLIHPQNPNGKNTESWINKGDKKEMMNYYKDWNYLVQILLSYVPEGEINEWTLNSHLPLPRWVQNKCALIGDSCHPMLPYVAQGAAQAIEDAAVLTISLSLADDVPTALAVYEIVRKSRGEAIQSSAGTTRIVLHLPDGLEQAKRDEAMGKIGRNPDLHSDNEWQDFMWGVDVMKDTLEGWNKWVALANDRSLGVAQ